MPDKTLRLCTKCIELFSESYSVRQFHSLKEERGRCDNCKQMRNLYNVMISSKDDEKTDDSYAG